MEEKQKRILVATFLVAAFFSALVIVGVLVASMPYNPVSTYFKLSSDIQVFMPEGWAFFTRNAREEDFFIFHQKDGEWEAFDDYFPNSHYRNAFGLNRQTRAISTEMVILLQQIKGNPWSFHDQSLNAAQIASLDTLRYDTVLNDMEHPYLCGKIAIARAAPVSWVFRRGGDKELKPFTLTYLESVCIN